MLCSYPAIFYYNSDNTNNNYQIYIPDLDAVTQGRDIPDSLAMASDLLGIRLADDIENNRPIPEPTNINKLELEQNKPFKDDKDMIFTYSREKSFISMVNVDLSEYLGSDQPVKKTLTIPKWADKLGNELHLNFSKTLTEAIIEKKLGA